MQGQVVVNLTVKSVFLPDDSGIMAHAAGGARVPDMTEGDEERTTVLFSDE